jgi:hypothetical protein
MQGVEFDELNIIGALLRAAPDYRPDYYRRLRNALAFDQKHRGNFWAAQEINRTLNPVTVLNLPRKKKQRRPQKLSTADFETWLRCLAERDMPVEAGALMVISLAAAVDGAATEERARDVAAAVTLEVAVDERAAVLQKHRSEWAVVRGLIGEAVRGRDGTKAKMAVDVGRALELAQRGERRAWGLDLPEQQGSAITVVIDR